MDTIDIIASTVDPRLSYCLSVTTVEIRGVPSTLILEIRPNDLPAHGLDLATARKELSKVASWCRLCRIPDVELLEDDSVLCVPEHVSEAVQARVRDWIDPVPPVYQRLSGSPRRRAQRCGCGYVNVVGHLDEAWPFCPSCEG